MLDYNHVATTLYTLYMQRHHTDHLTCSPTDLTLRFSFRASIEKNELSITKFNSPHLFVIGGENDNVHTLLSSHNVLTVWSHQSRPANIIKQYLYTLILKQCFSLNNRTVPLPPPTPAPHPAATHSRLLIYTLWFLNWYSSGIKEIKLQINAISPLWHKFRKCSNWNDFAIAGPRCKNCVVSPHFRNQCTFFPTLVTLWKKQKYNSITQQHRSCMTYLHVSQRADHNSFFNYIDY